MPAISRLGLAACLGALALAVVPAAHASTKTVYMGTPLALQKTLNDKYGSDVNDFFPHSITIHVGDSVRFVPTGFHTVDAPPKGGKAAGLFAPDGKKIAGGNDPQGSPYWFNGQDELSFAPAVLQLAFGKKVRYDGTKRAESGLPITDKPKPFTVTFAKAGTWTYSCDVHAHMTGIVKVVPAGRPIPSAAADAKTLKAQVARSLADAKATKPPAPPADTVSVGGAGPHNLDMYSFFPRNLNVTAGSTVHFVMPKGSVEIHTATIGPGDPEKQASSFLGKLAGSLQSPNIDQAALYTTDPPGSAASLTSSTHGNGFWNSGLLATSTSAPPIVRSRDVKFDGPGTYQVYCLIHPFMHGTVTVR